MRTHDGDDVDDRTVTRSETVVAKWNSRAHRKRGRGPLTGSMLWAPRALAWWVAILFMIGSACFAIGPLPGYLEAVGFTADAVTFFVGSLFFTSAALCQYIEVVVAPVVPGAPPRRRPLGMEFRRVDWWAAGVQLVGTVWFNVTTFSALLSNLDAAQAKRYIWMPDVIGSICFLVASQLAFAEVGHHWFSWMPKRRSWRITAINLLGSIAFGISAIASFIVPQTGEPVSLRWTNLGTFLGALCFLVGAAWLLPERMHPDE